MPPCVPDSGDTAWTLASSVLVLGMIPGLALFEAGLLRLKNSVSVLTQTLGGLVSLACLWILVGYTLTFGPDHGGVIGDFSHALFIGVKDRGCVVADGVQYNVPTAAFAIFQMMFACVTPLLITGTVAERMRWKPFLAFVILWEIIVYYPLAHWIWGSGWLDKLGTQDFAGGIVIHTSSGISALVIAHMLGRRVGYEKYHGVFPHSDMRIAAVGATLLWVGWFGFNGGSALAANEVGIQAVINTQVGAVFSSVVWLVCGWIEDKPSALHLLNGAIAGMAGITPASGYIATQSAVVVGIMLGLSSFYGAKLLHKVHIDDALEVSCIHGLTGVIGALAIGFCGDTEVNPAGANGLIAGGGAYLLGVQVLGVVIALVYSGFITWLLLVILRRMTPLRARPEHERGGLDFWHHRLDVTHREERTRLLSQTPAGDDKSTTAAASNREITTKPASINGATHLKEPLLQGTTETNNGETPGDRADEP